MYIASVSTWMVDHQGRPGAPGYVRRCGLKSVTDRLNSRYRVLTPGDVK